MPFEFQCPYCHARTEVDDRYAGKTGPCFSCGREVKMPELDDEAYRTARDLLTKKRQTDYKRLLPSMAITVVVMVLLVGTGWLIKDFVLPLIGPQSESAKQAIARKNLRRIGTALKAYHNEWDSLPPVYVADSAGRPMHSWRVLILPYLGEEQLYRDYDFSEPWNGPNNSLLISRMPGCFASPFDEDSNGFGETNFMALVGKESAFPQTGVRRFEEIMDRRSDTILIAEIRDSSVCWMDPQDLDTSRMRFQINADKRTEIGSFSSRGPLVLSADMEVYELAPDSEPAQIKALTTINGAEQVSIEDLAQ